MTVRQPHHVILIAAGAVFLLFALLYLFVLRPQNIEVRALRQDVTAQQQRLVRDAWPLDRDRLETLLDDTRTREREAGKRMQQVFIRCASVFRERILRLYETQQHFEQQVTRLDYQEEYHRIQRKFAANDVRFHERVLNLSEDSTTDQNYRLVLQLWTLEAALDQLLEHDLTPVRIPVPPPTTTGASAAAEPPDTPETRVAAVSVLPAQELYLTEQDEQAYLVEFTVRTRVAGTPENVQRFLLDAAAGTPFLAVKRIEMHKPVPEANADDNRVETDLHCSTYYLLRLSLGDIGPVQQEGPTLPPGA